MATLRQAVNHDVFPRLGVSICIGLVTGGIVSKTLTVLVAFGDNHRVIYTALSVGLGAIFGLFIGLSQAVWYAKGMDHTRWAVLAPDRLWDRWLDGDIDSYESLPEELADTSDAEASPRQVGTTLNFFPERARVRPRIISPVTGETVPLDDQIGQVLEEGRYDCVAVTGGAGSGKTTAFRHLAAVLPPWALTRVRLVDNSQRNVEFIVPGGSHDRLTICFGNQVANLPRQVIYSLAPWSQDDVIEYLLSAHFNQCSSVMARLKAADDRGFLKGIPELWTIVLDRMACDESLVNVHAAIRRELSDWFDSHLQARAIAGDLCLTDIGQNADLVLHLALSTLCGDPGKREQGGKRLLRLIRHRPVALLLAAERIRDLARHNRAVSIFGQRFSHDLVEEGGALITEDALARQHLGEWLDRQEQADVHAMAASLLHAAKTGWRPGANCRPHLVGAYLARAKWPGVSLIRVNLESADLKEADLSRANLKESQASQARFSRANLQEALLDSWLATRADLSGANLNLVQASRANFHQANLTGARFVEAILWRANLQQASIEGADFTKANLEEARLGGLKLRLARFDDARFGGADLRECDLEEMVLAAADFHDADLRKALLTGSQMHAANFLGADLRGAGLADIDWPAVNLRDADLRGASFHLGSSRSGLVDSLIACEGSRTGYYTDDYDEQNIKPVEEIRKANLRNADLRGANIEGVDFYLVDLRGAQYTREQAQHFRHCRAILVDRNES